MKKANKALALLAIAGMVLTVIHSMLWLRVQSRLALVPLEFI